MLICIRYIKRTEMSLAAPLFVTILGISLIAMPFFGTRDASAQLQQQRLQGILASFSGSFAATSLVKGTTVTALNPTANNIISVSLKHTGPENTPGVRVVTAALSIPPGKIALVANAIGPMLKSLEGSFGAANTTAPPPSTTNQIKALLQPLQIATGSSTLIPGWTSPSNVSVPLHGNTTLGEANIVSVQVLPLAAR
jgi:hypothetical protein